jgi:hypothetical protein
MDWPWAGFACMGAYVAHVHAQMKLGMCLDDMSILQYDW